MFHGSRMAKEQSAFVKLSRRLRIRRYVCLSVCLSVCPSVSVCLSVWLAGWLAGCLSVCLSVCLSACVHVHTIMQKCICACNICACMHTYIHTYIPTCIHTYIPTYIHTYIQTDRQTDTQTYDITYIHTYIHIYIYIYIYIYICTNTCVYRVCVYRNSYPRRSPAVDSTHNPEACRPANLAILAPRSNSRDDVKGSWTWLWTEKNSTRIVVLVTIIITIIRRNNEAYTTHCRLHCIFWSMSMLRFCPSACRRILLSYTFNPRPGHLTDRNHLPHWQLGILPNQIHTSGIYPKEQLPRHRRLPEQQPLGPQSFPRRHVYRGKPHK